MSKTKEPTVRVQPATQYVVHADFQGERTWAVYTLSEHGGTLTIQSDYGDFSHWWPERGEKFLNLMTRLGEEYFLKKLCKERTHFNYQATLQSWKESILEQRKEQSISEEDARVAWDALNETKEFSHNRDELLNDMLDEGDHTELFERVLGWDAIVEGTYMEFTLGEKNLYLMFKTLVVPKIKEEMEKRGVSVA